MTERDAACEDWLQYGIEDDHAIYHLRDRVKNELDRARKKLSL